MTHHTFHRTSLPRTLEDLAGYVSQTHIDGAKTVSEIFRLAKIRHALVGGLAVGINGYPHHTNDIDFLIDNNAFFYEGPLINLKQSLPIRYKNVCIDWIILEPEDYVLFDEYLIIPPQNIIPVIPIEGLFLMKLKKDRFKDKADLVEMIKSGADILKIKEIVQKKLPDKIALLEQLVSIAENE